LFAALALVHDREGYLIDATIVRAHQDASGAPHRRGPQEIGRSRGGPSTKIHALVDALGNPVSLVLSPGQTHEMKMAHELLADITDAYVVGDSAYSCGALVADLEQRRCKVVIASNPTHRQRTIDRHVYRERCLVEHFFQRLKRFRRIAMRFEKLSRNYLAFLHLASVLVWLL
jgi:transposase